MLASTSNLLRSVVRAPLTRYIPSHTRLLSTTSFLDIQKRVDTPFAFLPANTLESKETHTKGLTEIRGPYYAPVTNTYLHELLSDWGEYVDGIKFAGGAFSLMPEDRLKGLIDTAHKHGA